ncbi:MAG: hypothetical protein M1830_004550 [Pleopsidium flavum]|nr:MAG: hypothetical protein M1830_004550 [Pleopsidium flavum]
MVSHKSNELMASDQVKEAIFENIPGGRELGQRNRDTDEESRAKMFHQMLGKLSVIGRQERVRYGSWDKKPACLIAMKFQFNAKVSRFTRATVRVTFSRREDFDPDENPDIMIFGPKQFLDEKTIE